MQHPTLTPSKLVLALSTALLLSGCGSDSNDSGEQTQQEQQQEEQQQEPVVAKSVSVALVGLGDSILVTNQNNPTFSGIADSDVDITAVSYQNSTTGASGQAQGTENWQADIALQEGDNQIVITVTAEDGTTASVSTVLTYYPELSFTTPLTFSDDFVFVGEDNTVFFNIGTPSADTKQVTLYQTNAQGETIQEISPLKDDGVLPDEIQQDGIYSASVNLQLDSAGEQCYRIGVVQDEQSYFSENRCLSVDEHYTQAELTEVTDLADQAKDWFTAAIDSGMTQQQAAQQVVTQLQADASIGAADSTEDGGVWWITETGVLGVYHPVFDGQKSAGAATRDALVAAAPAQSTLKKPSPLTFYPAHSFHPKGIPAVKALDTDNRVESTKGMIISPYINNPVDSGSFGTNDDYYVPWQTIKNSNSCALYAANEVINNGSNAVTMDTFKGLGDYGYIHISTHGDNYYKGLLSLWKDVWGPNDFLKGSLSQVILYTGVVIGKDTDGNWQLTGTMESDLKAHRIAIAPGGSIVILPGFIKQYAGNLANSIVVLSACRSTYNNSMANAFISRGAGAVLGYTDYVSTSYAQNTLNTILTELYKDKTIKEAFDAAVSAHGSNDADSDPAALTLLGANNLKLSEGVLQNTSFETGHLSPWVKEGDGRIVSQLGTSNPTDGTYMGIISTGLGFTSETGSLTQHGCLANNAATLNFDWNFFSEEFVEYCNSQYQDTFEVDMCEVDTATGAETCSNLFSRNIDALCGAVTQNAISFDQGGVYNTGWIHQSVPVSGFAGKNIKLRFYSTDVGDSIYDTAILIDNIQIAE